MKVNPSGVLYTIAGVLLGLMCGRISGAESGWCLLVLPAGLALIAALAIDLEAFS